MKSEVKEILESVREGTLSVDDALLRLKTEQCDDIGFAKLDTDRADRCGFPEVVFCQGKTPEQVRDIFEVLAQHGTVMGTRATVRDFAAVQEKLPEAEFRSGLNRVRARCGDRAVLRALHFYHDDGNAQAEADFAWLSGNNITLQLQIALDSIPMKDESYKHSLRPLV